MVSTDTVIVVQVKTHGPTLGNLHPGMSLCCRDIFDHDDTNECDDDPDTTHLEIFATTDRPPSMWWI